VSKYIPIEYHNISQLLQSHCISWEHPQFRAVESYFWWCGPTARII